MEEQTVKVTVYMPDFLQGYIDQYAEKRKQSRSASIREMIDGFIRVLEYTIDHLHQEERERLEEKSQRQSKIIPWEEVLRRLER